MKVSEVSRLSNDALRSGLRELVAHDRTTTVRLLIHLGEFTSRRLYLEDAYESMHSYCVRELRMSADVAYKRIRVACKARRFPSILIGIADGTLTLTAVAMLSPYLSEATALDLLTAATGKTNAEIALLIAERFPQPDLATLIQPLSPLRSVETPTVPSCQELAVRPIVLLAEPNPRPVMAPLSPERFVFRITVGHSLKEKLEHAKNLLGHQAPHANEEEVLERALDALIEKLEKRKFAATDHPRSGSAREGKDPRHIPARVKRTVGQRDGHRCTFMAANGRRCESRRFLEFDHIEPVARGGRPTTTNLRLRCRAHNQLAAEQALGPSFMQAKRDEAQQALAKKRAEEVIPWLQALGIRADHARQAATRCEAMPNASLEERVKAALRCFAPRDVQLARATPAT